MNNIEQLSFEDICQKISNIYNNKEQVAQEVLEALFVRFTKQLFMLVFNIDHEPFIEVVDSKEFAGCYDGFKTFKISRQSLKEFQKGKALSLFETIGHELHHFHQKRQYKNINIKNSIIEKDNYLKGEIINYYDVNYYLLMQEVDAFLSQQQNASEVMHALGIKPSAEELAVSNIEREELQKIITSNRIIDGNIKNVTDIFEEKFQASLPNMDEFDRNNFFEFNPCTNIEYKIVGNKLVRKTVEEIKGLYNDWSTGNIKLAGLPVEIDTYFKYIIEKFDTNEFNSGDKAK